MYLVHHGILGQKWGVRRYQNKDGTLTEAGKLRLDSYKAKETERLNKKYSKRITRSDEKQKLLESNGTSEEKILKEKEKKDRLVARQLLEQEFIKNMTIEQMLEEQKEVRSVTALSIIASVGTFLVNPVGLIVIPNASAVKESRRRAVAGQKQLGFFEHKD